MTHRRPFPVLVATALTLTLALVPGRARAHCDTLDGPVVTAARTALETGKLEPVLAWVPQADEKEIRDAFASTRTVRKGGGAARDLADRWFFETLVRIHRAGEGAPYTGLLPAGTVDPAVAATDRIVAGGDAKALEALLVKSVRDGLHVHLDRLGRERPPADDVAAGRRWVAAYVPFVHWAEGVLAAAERTGANDAHAGHAAKGDVHAAHAPKGGAPGARGDAHAEPGKPAGGHGH